MKKYYLFILLFVLLLFSENAWELKLFDETTINEQILVKIVAFFCLAGYLLYQYKYKNDLSLHFKNIIYLFFVSVFVSKITYYFILGNFSTIDLIKALLWFSGFLIYFLLITLLPEKKIIKSYF